MIALTQGQIRRRMIARVRAALWSMPWWVILMGLLFHGSGQLLFKGGQLAMGTCADCCGGGCSACPSASACSFCSGDTPTQWAVSFTGVQNAMPCTDCAHSSTINADVSGGSGTLGTYTGLAQTASNCVWRLSTTGPSFLSAAPGTSCASPTSNNGIAITVTKVSGTIFLNVGSSAVTPVTFSTAWFFASAATDDCCAAYTMSNSRVAYTCDNGSGVAQVGINGSAVLSPC